MSWSLIDTDSGQHATIGNLSLINVQAGDLLIFAAETGSTTDDWSDLPPTDNQSNVWQPIIKRTSWNSQTMYVWWTIATAAGTVNIDGQQGSSFDAYIAAAFRPSGGTVTVDARISAEDNGGSSFFLTDYVRLRGADDLVLCFANEDGAGGTLTPGSGFTNGASVNLDGTSNGFILSYLMTASPGYIRGTANYSGTTQGVIALIAFSTDITQSVATIPIPTDADDNSAFKFAGTWAGIASGTFNVESDNTLNFLAQSLSAGTYYKDNTFWRFDTGNYLDAYVDIQWAELVARVVTTHSDDGAAAVQLAADYYDFGGDTPVDADWINSIADQSSIVSLVGCGYLSVPGVKHFFLEDISGIKRDGEDNDQSFTGYTGIRLAPNGSALTAPTGLNDFEFEARENTGTNPPKLVVRYIERPLHTVFASPSVAASVPWGASTDAWGTPNNGRFNDGILTSVFLGSETNESEYLSLTTFGITLPAQSNVLGIEAEVEFGSAVSPVTVTLTKNGTTVAGTGKLSAGIVNAEVFGGPSDLWGGTWLQSEIEATTFGVMIQASGFNFSSMSVDYASVRVFYEPSAPPPDAGPTLIKLIGNRQRW